MKIHPTAIIDPGADIAEDVEIGPHTIVESDVVIGEGCRIASSALIASGTRLAAGIKVFHSAVIGTIPQDLKFAGEYSTAEIGENTVIREFCTVNRGTADTGKTTVGENCLLMAYSHIAHDCRLGDQVIIANAVNMAGHVTIQDFVIIGGMTAIHQFVNIGLHCMIGGMFRITKDIPPYCIAGGWPVKYENVNSIGLQRRGFSTETRNAIKDAYRLIYHSGILRKEALIQLEGGEMIPEVKNIVEFYRKSQRGVI
ncbi:MAG: acyl-ACP--UDP-N-acetylglucosamine O-acyltransferase [candidate division Zixibacteria bacterium]|nr:acyl-ACP--UDP-N-acetylglucosamine O-acyltransferase [Candidatus Tariuqbacter arcticus]